MLCILSTPLLENVVSFAVQFFLHANTVVATLCLTRTLKRTVFSALRFLLHLYRRHHHRLRLRRRRLRPRLRRRLRRQRLS